MGSLFQYFLDRVCCVNHTDADTALVGKVLNHKSSLATTRYAKCKITKKGRALQKLGAMVAEAKKNGKIVEMKRGKLMDAEKAASDAPNS